MRSRRLFSVFVATAVVLSLQAVALVSRSADVKSLDAVGLPPAAPVRPVVDDYFGTKVTDPYRYMENLTDPEVQSWIKAQNDYARVALARIPGRSKMRDRLRELDQSAPAFVSDLRDVPGDLYFYPNLPAGAGTAKLYMRHGLGGEEKLVFDPDTTKLAPANQSKRRASIQYYVPSPDTRLVIAALTPGGSEDDTELHVIETATGLEIGMNDPRTNPWYSTKLAARLQAATSSGEPILLRVEYGGGHFGDPSYNAGLEEATDEICFDLWQLGAPGSQPH
jgi:protease II